MLTFIQCRLVNVTNDCYLVFPSLNQIQILGPKAILVAGFFNNKGITLLFSKETESVPL